MLSEFEQVSRCVLSDASDEFVARAASVATSAARAVSGSANRNNPEVINKTVISNNAPRGDLAGLGRVFSRFILDPFAREVSWRSSAILFLISGHLPEAESANHLG